MKLSGQHRTYILMFALAALYLFTRLYHLLDIPIFTDESIYIRWAQIFSNDTHQMFISLTDGKQPLFVWLAAPFLNVFGDPLLGARSLSVVAGMFTAVGIYFVARELFEAKRIAIFATALYVLCPFTMLYDKLALYDSLLTALAVWALYFEVRLVRRLNARAALGAAIFISAGLLTKSSAFFFLYLFPGSLLLFNFKKRGRHQRLMRWGLLASTVTIISFASYSILRLSPNFHFIADKNHIFVYPFSEWIHHPFMYLFSNLRMMIGFLVSYLTLPILTLVLFSFVVERQYLKQKLLLALWFLMPFSALALFGKVIFPRYILFMTMPLLVLAAYGAMYIAGHFKKTYITVAVCATALLLMAHKDYTILTNFGEARLPQVDRSQFIAGYASGVGVSRTVDFLRAKSLNQQIYVGTQGTFGLMPYALKDYFNGNTNIIIDGYYPLEETPPVQLLERAKIMPTYFVFYAPCPTCLPAGLAPTQWRPYLKQLFQIERLEKNTYYSLYEFIPPNNKPT